jgi:hypothetical protein
LVGAGFERVQTGVSLHGGSANVPGQGNTYCGSYEHC